MVEVPAALFYVALVAMVVVSVLLAVLLYYLIKVAKLAHSTALLVDEETRKIRMGLQQVRRTARLFLDVFSSE